MDFLDTKSYKELVGIGAALSGENSKGILSADESLPAFSVMFKSILLENNEEMRRRYRQIIFTTPKLQNYISGVLLSPEAVQQITNQGIPFPDLLRSKGMLPGVSVDEGLGKIKLQEDEWVTLGLDDLSSRCINYKKRGCAFTNWRAVIKVNRENPTPLAIHENATALARYASIVQNNKLVPMVEIEIVTEGSSHPLERTQKVMEVVLAAIIKSLQDYKVILEAFILRVSMVLPGSNSNIVYTPEQIAEATLTVLQRTVPPAVAGIAFVSGDQLTDEVTVNLDMINCVKGRKPWPLTFSFSRPLQAGVLVTWLGRDDWVPFSQEVLIKLVFANSAAVSGVYVSETMASVLSEKFSLRF